jgi:hypothetical protein
MTKAYFWKTLGRYEHHTDNLMLLDTDELYSGKRINVEYLNVASSKAIVLDGQKQYSEKIFSQIPQESKDWIRVSADFTIKEKEWEVWRMTQMIVVLKNGDQDIKRRYIRVQRHLYDHQTKQLSMDISIPDEPVNSIEIFFWNAESQKEILVDNVAIELYDEG